MKDQRKIKILVADDHAIVRRGLVSLLSLSEDLVVVGEAENGRMAVELSAELDPDVVLMDIGMPVLNGLEATRQIKAMSSNIKVLVLSGYDNEEYILQVIRTGANGYLLKNTYPEELFSAIKSVHSGQAFFSPAVSKVIIENYVKGPKAPTNGVSVSIGGILTAREREILQLIAEGNSHSQIAQLLHISIRTVDTHRNNIMRKLDLHDTASLVTYAIKNGIVILPR